jgi:hypothetical protein
MARVGPDAMSSSMVTCVVPPACGSRWSTTSASPAGQARARSRRRDRGSDSTTVVLSLMSAGQEPTEWCRVAPASGHCSSTSRMREAPTTHTGYSHPSLRMSQTCSGVALMTRLTLLMVQ